MSLIFRQHRQQYKNKNRRKLSYKSEVVKRQTIHKPNLNEPITAVKHVFDKLNMTNVNSIPNRVETHVLKTNNTIMDGIVLTIKKNYIHGHQIFSKIRLNTVGLSYVFQGTQRYH